MSALQMGYAQRVRYAEDNILRVTQSTMNRMWGPDVIDLDAIVLGVVRCPDGGDDCSQACGPGDCQGNCCDNAELTEYVLNVPGDDLTCDTCGSRAHVVEVVGTWGAVKDEVGRED
jgi:hypothetical protein